MGKPRIPPVSPSNPPPRSSRGLGTMTARRVLLPAVLLALLAAILLCSSAAFVNGSVPVSSSAASLRGGIAQRAVPEVELVTSSMAMADYGMQVSTPGWWANILSIIVPVTFLITLYLQSERTKAEEGL